MKKLYQSLKGDSYFTENSCGKRDNLNFFIFHQTQCYRIRNRIKSNIRHVTEL